MSFIKANDDTTPGSYKPSQTALLLLDFHAFFTEKLIPEKGLAALQTAVKMRSWAKSRGIQVIHGLIATNEELVPRCKDGQIFQTILSTLKEQGGAEEAPLLLEGSTEGERFYTRQPGYISALYSPGLPETLKEQGITSLIIAGLSTSGCVLRTAVPATDAGYVVTVLSDGCADRDQELHDVLVQKVISNRAYVTTSSEFIEGYEKSQS